MSRSTFGISPELDKTRTVCRLLYGFSTAYSRLPGGPVKTKGGSAVKATKGKHRRVPSPRIGVHEARLRFALAVAGRASNATTCGFPESQLRRVFDRHQPLFVVDERREHAEELEGFVGFDPSAR
jgi:hypothetical protein